MAMIDDMLMEGGTPALMECLGDAGACSYASPGADEPVQYDAILGRIRITEEPKNANGFGGLSELVQVERQTVSVVPKASYREIVDSGKVKIKQHGSSDFEDWLIDSITSATSTMITLELKRPQRKRGPESR